MAGTSRKNPVFANPFYVGLMVVSTLFVVTALGYLVAPHVIGQGPARRGAMSAAFAIWLDRHGPVVLGIEFLIMLVTGVLAMATDDWFSGRPGSQKKAWGSQALRRPSLWIPREADDGVEEG